MPSITPTPIPEPRQPMPGEPGMMPHDFVPPDFGELLEQMLDERNLSQRAFSEMVGTSHTQVRRIIEGERTPPERDELLRWAEKLSLSGERRDIFVGSGTSARAKRKADTSDYVRDLERKLAKAVRDAERAETRSTHARDTLLMYATLFDQTVALLSERGVELPQSLQQLVAQLRDRIGKLR